MSARPSYLHRNVRLPAGGAVGFGFWVLLSIHIRTLQCAMCHSRKQWGTHGLADPSPPHRRVRGVRRSSYIQCRTHLWLLRP